MNWSTKNILAGLGIIFAAISYLGVPTLGVGVILIGVAVIIP